MPAVLNDGAGGAPRLRPTYALWGLISLPRGGPEWSLDEKAQRVAEAGFEAVEAWGDEAEIVAVTEVLCRHKLRFAYGLRSGDISRIREGVSFARKCGADYVNLHLEDPYIPLEEMVSRARAVVALSEETGFPIFIETHRGTATESLANVWRIVEAVPDIRFCADLSHIMLASETTGMDATMLAPILERTSSFHARVSNGEQIQVDVGDGSAEPARTFVKLWTEAMRHWKQRARPGDVLPFVSELGPPTYSIVDLHGNEVSDRWEQGLMMKRLGEEGWADAG